MNKIWILIIITLLSCNSKNKKTVMKKEKETSHIKSNFNINFDSEKISNFSIEKSEFTKTKALTHKLSDYTSQELNDLPDFLRLTLSIVVPSEISKESLENTLKSITYEKTENNRNIDEIIIFAYDNKEDIGNNPYTFGKLLWTQNGELGMITPEIVTNKDRSNYKLNVQIKQKVGNIKKEELPTKRELEIYDEITNEKYIGMDDDKIRKIVMKKFNIKTKEEYKNIYLKVGVYKLF